MEIDSIVWEICDEADDFLTGVMKRDEARAGIAEWLTIRYTSLASADKNTVTDRAMTVLIQENFFNADAGGEN